MTDPRKPVTVEVKFDGAEWWKLAGYAERRQIEVPELLASIGRNLIMPVAAKKEAAEYGNLARPVERRHMTAKRLARMKELHAIGLSDGEIAERIGLSDETVREYRNTLGLPPVRQGRRTEADLARIALIEEPKEHVA